MRSDWVFFRYISVILVLNCCYIDALSGQRYRRTQNKIEQRFAAAILFGTSFTQMDGDYFTGYDLRGWYGGLRGVARISPSVSLNVEMLYNAKGSKIPHGVRVTKPREVNDRQIRLHYAEVPLYVKIDMNSSKASGYAEFGAFYSRLFDTTIDEKNPGLFEGTIYREIENEFSSSDFGLLGGLGFEFNIPMEIGARYSFSLGKFYENENYEAPNPLSSRVKEVAFLRNYGFVIFLAFRFL